MENVKIDVGSQLLFVRRVICFYRKKENQGYLVI
jgi:hypothetical protein